MRAAHVVVLRRRAGRSQVLPQTAICTSRLPEGLAVLSLAAIITGRRADAVLALTPFTLSTIAESEGITVATDFATETNVCRIVGGRGAAVVAQVLGWLTEVAEVGSSGGGELPDSAGGAGRPTCGRGSNRAVRATRVANG